MGEVASFGAAPVMSAHVLRLPLLLALVSTTVLGCSTSAYEAPDDFAERVSLSPGCSPNPGIADGIIEMPAQFDVPTRYYRVDVPPDWNGTDPIDVVYFFHGCGGDQNAGAFNSLYYPMANMGTGESAIIVIGESEDLCWNIGPDGPDVAYFEQLKDEIESAYCLDLDEIHYGGVSSGAFAANGFSCRFGGTSAYAVSGGIFNTEELAATYGLPVTDPPTADDCVNPVPVVLMHGVNDPVVDFQDNAIPTRDAWLDINGCTTASTPLSYPIDLCQNLPEPCSCEIYDQCTTGAPVVWCTHDGGHIWPQSLRNGAAIWYGQWDAPMSFPVSGGTSGTMSSGPDPTTGMGDPTTGMVDPTTGMVDPTTGLVDPTTGAVDPTTGAVDPTTGAVDPTTGAVDTTAGGSTGGMPPGGSGGGCAVVLDEDTFETLDTSRWFVLEDGTNDVFIDADELVTFVDSGGGNRAFVRTNATYDLSDFAATIEVTDIPTDLTYADIRLELVDEMWSWVALKTAWGGLQARGSSGNFAVLSPYDPDAFRFWRIRTLDGTIFFEVSADGEIWELVEERANPLMGQVWVVLRMQRAGNSAPGEVRMDNFLLGQGCE